MRKRTCAHTVWTSWGSCSRIRLWAGIWSAFFVSAAIVGLALSLPRLADDEGRALSLVENREFVVVQSSATRGSEPSTRSRSIPLDDLTRLEEPDVLDEWEKYRRFVKIVDQLHELATQESSLELVRADGSLITAQIEVGSLALLSWSFWLQIATALFCAITGELTWRLARPSPGLLGYRLAGWGVAFAAWASALYATRSIGLSAELLEAAHAVNTIIGGPLFGAGLCMLLASEPRLLMRRPALWLMGLPVTAFLWWGRFPGIGPAFAGYFAILTYTVAIAALLAVQRFSLRLAVEQAVWRWLTLGVVSGIVFFVLAQAVPIALGIRPLASQTMTLLGFAWLFGLLSLGASRYRLFSVARYWGRTWKWLAITSVLLAVDLAVLAVLPREDGSYSWVILLCGLWLYFPLRQFLAQGLHGQKKKALLDGTRRLSHAASEVDLLRRFEDELERHFEATGIEVIGPAAEVCLALEGQELVVPWPRGEAAFVLRYKRAGRELFDNSDVEETRVYLEFARNLLEARDAYLRGEADERQRVRRDLHDHLGARLSRLALVSDDANVAREIADLSRELRQLTIALTGEPIALDAMIMELESETRAAGRTHGLSVHFSIPLGLERGDVSVDARRRSDWIAFVRESLENAARHGQKGGDVRVELFREDAVVSLQVTSWLDEVQGGEPRPGGLRLGTGLVNLRRRAQLSGGKFSAEVKDGQFVTSMQSSLSKIDISSHFNSSVRRIVGTAQFENSSTAREK